MATTFGFIGLGVMGDPMCRNLAKKSGAAVVAFDQRVEPLAALARDGVGTAGSAAEVVARADVVFMCLPGEPQVRAVALGPDGLAARVRAGQTVVDMSTAPVGARARAGPGVRRPRRRLRRRPGGAHRPGGEGWHAVDHGRRRGGGVRAAAAVPRPYTAVIRTIAPR
jgi:hypothetical protein